MTCFTFFFVANLDILLNAKNSFHKADPHVDLHIGTLHWTIVSSSASTSAAKKIAKYVTEYIAHVSAKVKSAKSAGTAAALGYKVITLYPDESGIPDLNALKAAVSPRTAALLITNPEDTGIYNEKIREFVDIVHAAGGLCVYDQANLNGLMGITRARDAGFDLCQFNLHKTFSSPHGSQGPGAGAQGCTEELAQFLPLPTVEFDGTQYYLDYNRQIGRAHV